MVAVLGFGIMHPRARALVPMRWTRRHDIEFTVLTRLLRMAYRWLPSRITETPLARNRREYERIIARYRGWADILHTGRNANVRSLRRTCRPIW